MTGDGTTSDAAVDATGLPSSSDVPSEYRTGNESLDAALAAAVASVDDSDRALVFEMMVTALRLSREGNHRGDLKLVNAAMKELRYSFEVFAPYAATRKCTIFGSARIRAGDPAYDAARAVARRITEHDWMVITGAGPGIMEAGHEGAGAERSFGVNIVLPFEASANPVIADDPKLINFRYFFTRKVMFMKESDAYVLLPGGFGTMDESFELLTLMQTGKTPPAPIVLLDPAGSDYWDRWEEFVRVELAGGGLISDDDLALVHRSTTVEDAIDEITGFYQTYHSMRFVGERLVFRLHRRVGDDELAELGSEFAPMLTHGGFERIPATTAERRDDDHVALERIAFRFDRHKWSGLRRLIDRLNGGAPPE